MKHALSLVFLLALVPLACGLRLGDYSYLLVEAPQPDFYVLGAQSYSLACEGFAGGVGIPDSVKSSEEFAKAVGFAGQARDEYGQAAILAGLSPWLVSTASGPAGRALYAVYCFGHGVAGLNYAVRAAKAGAEAADKKVAELELMTDDSFTGAATGLLEDLSESKATLDSRDASQDNLGGFFLEAAIAVNEAGKGLALSSNVTPPNAAQVRLAGQKCMELLGRESVLFDSATAAVAAMEDEQAAELASTQEEEARAKQALETAESLGLQAVQEDAFLAVGAGSAAATEYAVQSFEEDLWDARASLEKGSRWIRDAQAAWRAKGRGYAGKSVMLLRNATAELLSCEASLAAYGERGRELEDALREQVNLEVEEARALAQGQANEYAYAQGLAGLEQLAGEADKRLHTVGERITFYLRLLSRVREIKAELRGWDQSAFEEKALLGEETERVDGVLKAAEKEGLDIAEEKARLGQIKDALKSLGSGAGDAGTLGRLSEDLKSLEDGVYAFAYGEYAPTLEGLYAQVAPLENFLDSKNMAAWIEAGRLFTSDGGLKEREGLGQLRQARESLEGIIAWAESRAPALLREHLAATAEIGMRAQEPFQIGKEVLVTVTVRLENALPLAYGGLLAVESAELREALDGVENANASEGASVANGAVYLQGVSRGAAIEIIATKRLVAAKRLETKTEASGANEEATVARTFGFESTVAGRVLLDEALDARETVTRVETDEGSAQWNGAVKAFANFGKGKHWFKVESIASGPVKAERTVVANGFSIEVAYGFLNDFIDLKDYAYSDSLGVGCEPSAAQVLAQKARATVQKGGTSFVSIDFGEFRKGETERVLVRLTCQAGQAAQQKAAEVEALATALNESRTTELDAIKADLAAQRYGDALAKALALEKNLLSAKKTAEDGQLDGLRAQARALAAKANGALAMELLTAANKADAAFQNQINSIASREVAALDGECGACAAEARALFAIGKPLDALEEVLRQRASLPEQESPLTGYLFKRSDAVQLLADYAAAFKADESDATKVKRSTYYAAASKQAAALEKAMKTLDAAVGDSAKAAKANASLQDFAASLAGLEAALGKLKAAAEAELGMAEAQQKQFGNPGTEAKLADARKKFDAGEHYAALSAATALRSSLLGPATGAATAQSADWRLGLGLFGVLALAALAWMVSKRGEGKSVEM
ncbi:hypothetical protein COY71_03470 [Candidatus Micrarchaeota archaeon CG_4_10_14_0_8_um_filter_60_7]|nr:MAG: hypothetical protein COY71_03470 [Candidatus Micrarchaeota archaeon CG_4_10_14_0_8_um_filter_60_7]